MENLYINKIVISVHCAIVQFSYYIVLMLHLLLVRSFTLSRVHLGYFSFSILALRVYADLCACATSCGTFGLARRPNLCAGAGEHEDVVILC